MLPWLGGSVTELSVAENCRGRSDDGPACFNSVLIRWSILLSFKDLILKASTASQRSRDAWTIKSISGNDYDCDDNECRDQRKSAIESFRSGLCDIVERGHELAWRLQFANEPANISGFHWI
jgi:hypothetical protein